ncbi:class I tRNA ligase family protein [Hahella sp. SMD15-11]|uniref:Class I tRNA ligase family protein n=1 Tax=Thermohahella caldifontis TaxID=3142973 RepID=A0AB39UZ12_9GAMM
MKPLKIYNSLSGKKEVFRPLEPGRIRMYVCGVTVYDYCHIGHARIMVAFDMITRFLRQQGWDLTYVRNITDVDDKIIRRAAENGEAPEALTERFIQYMHEDERALGVLPPDVEPRATGHVQEIIALIERLIEEGFAYQGSNGDVFFDVERFDGYGKLSHRKLEDMIAGSRIDVEEAKRNPLDFVLWKQAKQGEVAWPSPWGKGGPGGTLNVRPCP